MPVGVAAEAVAGGGGAAAAGGEAGAGGGLGGGMIGKFGPQALMSKVMGGGHAKQHAEEGGGAAAVLRGLTTPGLATHAASSYGSVLQPGQFG